jgi:cell division protein ZipA
MGKPIFACHAEESEPNCLSSLVESRKIPNYANMKRMEYFVVIGVLAFGGLAFYVYKSQLQPAKTVDDSGFYLSTESQSNARVKSLNFDQPSEDASYILDASKLEVPEHLELGSEPNYRADKERDWVLLLSRIHEGQFIQADLLRLFDYDWRKNFRSEIYGFSPGESGWTFAFAADSPKSFDSIEVAVNLLDIVADQNTEAVPTKLQRYFDELATRIKKFPFKIQLDMAESTNAGMVRAQKMAKLHQEFSVDATVVLENDHPFSGIEVWDVLSCLGLVWGDGDLFHWQNSDLAFGSDFHFSVWTSTDPGYFFPEEMRNGDMNPSNLIFGFSIPRSADPENVFAMMLDAAKYCQKRLGGRLVDSNGELLNEIDEKAGLSLLVKQMRDEGIVPGSHRALIMF